MHLNPSARELDDAMQGRRVIDAHEHLPPEAVYLEQQYCGPNLFAGGYIHLDLASAGMPGEVRELLRAPGERPVGQWWPKVKPYWELIRHGSYARALRLTVRQLWDIDRIDDTTIEQIAEHVRRDNRPGLYHRVLRDTCNIEWAISCNEPDDYAPQPPVAWLSYVPYHAMHRGLDDARMEELSAEVGQAVKTLDDVVAATREQLVRELDQGALGAKIRVTDLTEPDRRVARQQFDDARRSGENVYGYTELRNLLVEECMDVLAERDRVMAVHTGYWGDFRRLDPKLMLDVCIRRPEVRFDVFHLGMPMIRDAILLGKSHANVTLNLCWCPVISQVQTVRALDEIIDLVPLNKVIAFGADYRCAVHKTVGHLAMARQCVAAALGARIDAGEMNHDLALQIADMWFYENPKQIYRLDALSGRDRMP